MLKLDGECKSHRSSERRRLIAKEFVPDGGRSRRDRNIR